MAEAKKCDRCGKYYDANRGPKSIEGAYVTGISINAHTKLVHHHCDFDFCDECVNKLYRFLLGHEDYDQRKED